MDVCYSIRLQRNEVERHSIDVGKQGSKLTAQELNLVDEQEHW